MQFVELENELASLKFLTQKDFEKLYAVASNAEIWAQHPDSSRYTLEGFSTYFGKLLLTDCPFLIMDRSSKKIIGATSFYEYDSKQKSVAIGYTFLDTSYWGGMYNSSIKKLLLDYAFQFVDKVVFHVRDKNIRSQRALIKIGAQLENSYPNTMSTDSMQLEFVIHKSQYYKELI